jgi:hypothetical protein
VQQGFRDGKTPRKALIYSSYEASRIGYKSAKNEFLAGALF